MERPTNGKPPAEFSVRRATVDDIPVLTRHRCEMFNDMGQLAREHYKELAEASARYFEEAIPSGEYVAWVVTPIERPEVVVAGGGVQLRHILPRPGPDGALQKPGPQGLVVNVYTEKEWRRNGLAALVMRTIIEWSKENSLGSLVLHASPMGRRLYERLGFHFTNEMSYQLE